MRDFFFTWRNHTLDAVRSEMCEFPVPESCQNLKIYISTSVNKHLDLIRRLDTLTNLRIP